VCLAIPGRIIEFDAENANLALVDVVGVRRKVDLGLLADEPPVLGDWVLIHVGFAMSKISEVRGYGLDNEVPPAPLARRAVWPEVNRERGLKQ
jgi:hydrogenase assembly chaperone HypC/HupF